MQISGNLIMGEVICRYKSLLLDVRLDNGEKVTAFCGSIFLSTKCSAGTKVYIRHRAKPQRVVKYELVFIDSSQGLIWADPSCNGNLFYESWQKGKINELSSFSKCQRIKGNTYGRHIDFELTSLRGDKGVISVVSIYGRNGNQAVFPSRISFFELEMFEEFARLRAKGIRTFLLMISPYNHMNEAKFSWTIDPVAAAKIFEQAKNGLEFICYGCKVAKNDVTISNRLNILY